MTFINDGTFDYYELQNPTRDKLRSGPFTWNLSDSTRELTLCFGQCTATSTTVLQLQSDGAYSGKRQLEDGTLVNFMLRFPSGQQAPGENSDDQFICPISSADASDLTGRSLQSEPPLPGTPPIAACAFTNGIPLGGGPRYSVLVGDMGGRMSGTGGEPDPRCEPFNLQSVSSAEARFAGRGGNTWTVQVQDYGGGVDTVEACEKVAKAVVDR